MCRVWGISYGPEGPEAEDWTPSELAQLMFPALVRLGPDAYGWMTWKDGDSFVNSAKFAGRCDSRAALKNMDLDPDARWIVAHTRWATHGSPNQMVNNHPIVHGKYMGVHNGVISNYEQILKQTGREYAGTEVDSEAIFAAINKWGHRAGLLRLTGDLVAVYVNLENPRTVHIARSMGRQLFMAKTPAGSTIWASEEQALLGLGIEITKPSPVASYRLLRIREGRVAQLVTWKTDTWESYRSPRGLSHAAQERFDDITTSAKLATNTKRKRAKIKAGISGITDYFEDRSMRIRSSAASATLDTARKIAAERGIRDGTKVQGLRYYSGVLVSENEYLHLLAEEFGYGDDDYREETA